jgi:hypothetical protein
MFIPNGATCAANIWQCNQDGRAVLSDVMDGFSLRPGRHLDDKAELIPGPTEANQEGNVSFGFGRRICVSKYLANGSPFIRTTRISWVATHECEG